MGNPVIQTSFNAGEWAPALYARVDLTKYHSGATLLQNYFVDYRGGATTRPGTKFVSRCLASATTNRLIPFQASFTVGYVLEFGNGTVRFYVNGAPVLENSTTITGVTQANPGVVTDVAHGYANGDWIVINNVVGMTQLNGNTYVVTNRTANTYQLTDLYGVVVDTSGFTAYVSGGTAQRVYTIASPYAPNELFGLRYAQDVNLLFICHPNHPPYVLTLNSATNWTLAPIVFGSTVGLVGGLFASTTLAGGSVNYAYVVTAVDINGQESNTPGPIKLNGLQDLRSVLGTNFVVWTAVPGAVSYNVYKAELSYSSAVQPGAMYGFIGNVTGVNFTDSNITPDFSQPPPVAQSPFSGTGVLNVTLTGGGGAYTVFPTVSMTAPPPGGTQATAYVSSIQNNTIVLVSGGVHYAPGDLITLPGGSLIGVNTVGAFGVITSFAVDNFASVTVGPLPTNPVTQVSTTSHFGSGATFNLTWNVIGLQLSNSGSGYLLTPSVNFSPAGATATATLGAPSAGNPTVPGFFQQRSVFGGPVGSPAQFNMSQPGAIYNFNTTDPVEPDNAIQGTLISGQLNTIQAFVPMQAGLITLTDKGAWLINGGSPGVGVSATSIVANPQAYNGSSALPPIIATYDILYVQAKGSIVRDLTYNFYTNIFTGTDISVLSSHLFYGFTLTQWAWAEEPFKIVWADRNDGTLLSLTFQKEQEMIAWAHSITQGSFVSIATITETTQSLGPVDAVYHIVQRTINGQTVQYVERFVELVYPADYVSSWQVDAGIGYNGVAATTFSGAQHLAGAVVTGVADGAVINFTMPVSGTFVFGPGGTAGLTGIANASVVTVGLSFLPIITTLPLDLGEPTAQGKRKKVSGLTLRVKQALGLSAGRTVASAVPLADTTLGQLGTMSNQPVTGLVTSDVRLIVDPQWDVFGQYSIVQTNPYPATILGVIPEISIGDGAK
jgi:hypothetical protein